MLYVVTYMCTIVGAYSCAVDANQCVRSLQRVGCMGATVCEVRLNSETPTGASLFLVETSAKKCWSHTRSQTSSDRPTRSETICPPVERELEQQVTRVCATETWL